MPRGQQVEALWHLATLGLLDPIDSSHSDFFLNFFIFFGLFRTTPEGYGSSHARGRIRAAAEAYVTATVMPPDP